MLLYPRQQALRAHVVEAALIEVVQHQHDDVRGLGCSGRRRHRCRQCDHAGDSAREDCSHPGNHSF
jgi:hypothetical protein